MLWAGVGLFATRWRPEGTKAGGGGERIEKRSQLESAEAARLYQPLLSYLYLRQLAVAHHVRHRPSAHKLEVDESRRVERCSALAAVRAALNFRVRDLTHEHSFSSMIVF